MQNSSLVSGACQISNGSVSPERPVGETSFSVPLHPTKRPASNPPPISNQATKGNFCTFVGYVYFWLCKMVRVAVLIEVVSVVKLLTAWCTVDTTVITVCTGYCGNSRILSHLWGSGFWAEEVDPEKDDKGLVSPAELGKWHDSIEGKELLWPMVQRWKIALHSILLLNTVCCRIW